MVCEVPLTKGYVALVDDEDFDRVAEIKWHTLVSKPAGRQPKLYAYHRGRIPGSKHRHHSVLLHRFIVDAPDGVEIDHVNGDGLDCQRHNIREATHSQNGANKTVAIGISGFRGVHRADTIVERWAVQIQVAGVRHCLGTFLEPIAAAMAYDKAARHYFGPFARLNFPADGERSALIANRAAVERLVTGRTA